jgi:hypothetical protein
MSDAWGGHQAAVFAAINNIGELQEALSLATDAAERTIGAIVEATGQSHVESANTAVRYTAAIRERIQECYGMSESAKAELERYVGGF